tara:strand:- start:990 stop:1328 length:339 start_codon:yes stop_codon:yes gene_type:complete
MRADRQLLTLTHLSQLLCFVTGIGGFVVPLIVWLTQKESVHALDEHGKSILNFQISMFLLTLLCVPLILLFGLGLLGIFVLTVFLLIFPIINAVKASNGEPPYYPLSLRILR